MILRKVVLVLVAVFATATAAAVTVVAAAFALFALLRGPLGPAGAAAVVAGAAALLMGLGALIAALMARPPTLKESDSFAVRMIDFAREKPLVAVAAAAAAGFIAVRNPKVVTTALTAFFAGKAAERK